MVRERLRAALKDAMKARDRAAMGALRSAIGVLDNAEAVDASAAPPVEDGRIAGGVRGLGAGDVARHELNDREAVELLVAELTRWRTLATDQPELLREARVVATALAGDVEIRVEAPDDRGAIFGVVERAFRSAVEARLVDAIRASSNFVVDWSLVATVAGVIVGHVLVSFVGLVDADGVEQRIVSLSPLAVEPALHGAGVGGALVRAVTERVDAAGAPLVILEGDPRYYSRFGFEPSAPLGITIALPDWAPPEAAQVLRLGAYDPSVAGHVVYPPAFADVSH